MKRNMQRKALLVLALVLSLGTVAGCGSASADEPGTTTPTVESPAEQPPAEDSGGGTDAQPAETSAGGYAGKYDPNKVINITWLPQCDRPVDEDSAVTKAIEERFNVEIEYVYIDRENQNQLLGVRLASGDIPDGWRTSDGNNYWDLVDQGVVAEIPMDMLEEVAPNMMAETQSAFAEYGDIFEFMKQDDVLYGIPVANLNGLYMLMNMWRDDWLKNVGIDTIPTTVEEAEAAFYAFANDDPDGNGADDTYAISNFGIRQFQYAYGGEPMNSLVRDGRVTKAVLEPEFKECIAKLAQYYADGLIDPEFTTGENRGQYWANSLVFQNGLIGFTQPGAYYHVAPPNPEIEGSKGSDNYEQFKALNPEGTFAYGTALKGPYPEVLSARWGNVPSQTFVMGANVDEEKMVRLLQIQEAMNSSWEDWLLIAKGLEGITYEPVDVNGMIDYREIWNPDGNAQYDPGISTNGFGYLIGQSQEFNKRSNAVGLIFAEEYATPEAMNCTPWTEPIFGAFGVDINDAVTACRTIVEENINLFISGQRPFNDEEWDSFIGQLETAGIMRWQEAAQAWYDENFG